MSANIVNLSLLISIPASQTFQDEIKIKVLQLCKKSIQYILIYVPKTYMKDNTYSSSFLQCSYIVLDKMKTGGYKTKKLTESRE